MNTNQDDSPTRSPYPLRLDPEVRAKAKEEAQRLERSLNWLLNKKLREAFGLEEAA